MEFQADIIKFIQSFHTPFLDIFFIIITNLGNGPFYFIALPMLYWSVNKQLGITLTMSILVSMYTNVVIKEITAVPRPIGYPGIRNLYTSSAGGFSLPSGHTQGTSTFWGVIMGTFKTSKSFVLGITIIFMVGLSRLYLGVHWPLDIVVGLVLGLTIAFLFLNWNFRNLHIYIKVFGSIITPLILIKLFPHPDNYKYMGMLLGVCLGSSLEDYFIGFKPKSHGFIKAVLKYTIGAVVFAFIYIGLKNLFPPLNIYSALRYFIIGIWFTLGAPMVFKKYDL